MCLYATTREALIAEEDIKVIKVVRVKCGKYYAPYQRVPLTDYCSNRCNYTFLCGNIIVSEGIHACTSIRAAIDHRLYLERCYKSGKFVFIKGIIPKGTYYWTDGKGEVAAKHIKFDRSKEKLTWIYRLIIKWRSYLNL